MSLRPEPRRARVARIACAIAGLTAVLAVTACTEATPAAPSATTFASTDTTATATPTPSTPVPAAPALVPDGSADDNLPIFSAVTTAVWATPENVYGRAYIDALVAVGFDKARMQVTEDLTTVGNAAESIQFSVLWDGRCLVGQVGPATGAPVTAVLPAIGEGTCLVGATRVIDW